MTDSPGEGHIFFLTSHDADAATLATTRTESVARAVRGGRAVVTP